MFCNKCKRRRPQEDFTAYQRKQKWRMCKECTSDYYKERRANKPPTDKTREQTKVRTALWRRRGRR